MAFRLTSAAPAIRSLLARPPTATSRQFVRRMSKYTAENPHIIKGSNSDLPWIIGAVAVTIPGSFYLLSGNSKPDHHANDASTGHGAHRDISKTASQAAEKASKKTSEVYSDVKNKVTSSDTSASDTASEVKEKGSEKAQNLKEKASETAEETKEKTSKKVEDLKEKGSEKVDALKEKGGEKAAELKAATKKKAGKESSQEKPPSETDEPAAAIKPPKSMNEQSGKQEGISNSETNHAVLGDERGQAISKKSEGTHDTAKLKGTVDPNREAK